MATRSPVAARGAPIILALTVMALAAPPAALAARLVGGSQQRAIQRAFTAQRSHRGQAAVSIRASSVSPSWSVVRSVSPERAGRSTPGASSPRLRSSYYHRVGGRERPGSPPAAVRADLARDFRVQIVYTGSGSESISYGQTSRSVCPGAGKFTDQETVSVTPMAWSVRYVVDLDNILSAVRGSAGAVIMPSVSFDGPASHLDAVETVSRTLVDAGCNGTPVTFTCTTTFGPGGQDPAGELSFPPGSGIEIGLPLGARMSGSCDPNDYTLGPSLWDSGATTALAGGLRLMGGALPANPYAPVGVSWPGGSAQQTQGFIASPCQGGGVACVDDFRWRGTVAIRPFPGG
jgi:hypothetical protein